MSTQQEKCETLESLHATSAAWIIPNPWDVGSAKLLQGMGFKALATTSAGFAFTLGRDDGEVTLEEKLQHCAALAAATSIPVSVDFENGFADDPQGVAENVRQLAQTGVAGCSIEDYSREGKYLYDPTLAIERVQAAVEVIVGLDMPFQLTARAENFMRGVMDMEDTLRRLLSYESVGAHVLYAPGLSSIVQIREVKAATSRPLNVLSPFLPGVSLAELGSSGATRVSLGNALNAAALYPLLAAGDEMMSEGSFGWLQHMASGKKVAALLK